MPDTQISDEMVRVAHAEYHIVLGHANRSDPMRDALTAALAGHVVVPREPTGKMIDAALLAGRNWSINMCPKIVAVYRAMIDAAPPVSRGE